MAERVHLTRSGLDNLKKELKTLTSVERPAIIKAIEEARAHGDLSENAEYSAAKERQGFIEGRIRELEDKVSRAEVVDPAKLSTDRVVFGLTVTVYDTEQDREATYQLVGPDETDAKAGRISVTSPIGRALIGKEAGDSVTVRLPNGTRELEIVEISH